MEWPWSPGTPLAAHTSFSDKVMELMWLERKFVLAPNWSGESLISKNSPPVMWHAVAGADDSSSLVAVTSMPIFSFNKFHVINRDFQSHENGKWTLPRPLQYRMTRRVHSSKRREWKVGLDAEDFPLCLHLGVKCEKSRTMRVEKMPMK